MNTENEINTYTAVCPFCGRMWHPDSDGYNERSYCDDCLPERIKIAQDELAARPVQLITVGSYAIEVPSHEEALSRSLARKENFKPRKSLFRTH